MSLVIIGLVGAKGAGKSTFARIAKEVLPNAVEGALANRLKDVCARVFQVPRGSFDHPDQKERYLGNQYVQVPGSKAEFAPRGGPIRLNEHTVAQCVDSFGYQPSQDNVYSHTDKTLYTPRQLAQYVGTEVLRSLDPDVHCKGLMMDAPKEGILIVTDIRFPNERAFFEKLAGDLFFPVYVRNERAEAEAAKDPHQSEQHLKAISEDCYVAENDGTLEEFEAAIKSHCQSIIEILSPPVVVEEETKESA